MEFFPLQASSREVECRGEERTRDEGTQKMRKQQRKLTKKVNCEMRRESKKMTKSFTVVGG